MEKKKIIIFIDTFARKNELQFNCIQKLGLQSIWFVTSPKDKPDIITLEASFLNRIIQVFSFLKKNKKCVKHVEIYPGGRFSFIYAVLARFFGLKVICVERGDLQYYKPQQEGGYDKLTRISMFVTYKLAHLVWYREPYMLGVLEKIGVKKLYFISNCVRTKPESKLSNEFTFLWVNRVTTERNAIWFVRNLSHEAFINTKNILLGLLKNQPLFDALQEEVISIRPNNLDLIDYADPTDYLLNSKFFVLPALAVYLNNSLLEAMSYGVVPLISYTTDSAKIVTDGVDGFIFEHTPEAFLACMQKAISLSEVDYQKMSAAAKQKIATDFSEDVYYQRLAKMYNEL